jgi:hypothetical protein
MINNLRNLGIQYIRDIPTEKFFELKIPILLADYWISLGEQLSEFLSDFVFIKHSVVSANEKIVEIWSQLQNSTKPVSVSQFIQALERIIPLIQHSKPSTPSTSPNNNHKHQEEDNNSNNPTNASFTKSMSVQSSGIFFFNFLN